MTPTNSLDPTNQLELENYQKILEIRGWVDISDLKESQIIDISQKITKSKLPDPVIFIDNYDDWQSEYPKTEGAFQEKPPKYIAVWGIELICLVNIDHFLLRLTQEEQSRLFSQYYQFKSNNGKEKITAPILQFLRFNNILARFSYQALRDELMKNDPFLKDICTRLKEYFDDNHIKIRLKSNSLVIFNNWEMIHFKIRRC